MESKKLNSKLSEEELLTAINSDSPETSRLPPHVEEVINFLTHFGIEEGKHSVTTELLFKLYFNWSKAPMPRKIFAETMKLYIPKTNLVYKINLDKFNITKQLYNYLASGRKRKIDISPTVKQKLKKFQTHYGIKPGNHWVEFEVLYYLYDKWVYKNKSNHGISKPNFKAILNVLFETRLISKYGKSFNVYRVDPCILNHVTEEEIEQILKGSAGMYGKKSRKAKKENC